MKTILLSLHVALLAGSLAFAGPTPQFAQRSAHTKLAKFDLGAYLAKNGTLRVNVDKQLGGEVEVLLKDTKGNVYYQRTLSPQESNARLAMNLSELGDGDYVLKVSNGLEMIVRDVKIASPKPTTTSRTISFR